MKLQHTFGFLLILSLIVLPAGAFAGGIGRGVSRAASSAATPALRTPGKAVASVTTSSRTATKSAGSTSFGATSGRMSSGSFSGTTLSRSVGNVSGGPRTKAVVQAPRSTVTVGGSTARRSRPTSNSKGLASTVQTNKGGSLTTKASKSVKKPDATWGGNPLLHGRAGKGGPYANLSDTRKPTSGGNFSQGKKQQIRSQNIVRNNLQLRSDKDGSRLVRERKSTKGVTPSQNGAQVDHIKSKKKGGSNSYSNAQVLSRQQNRTKGSK